MKRIKFASTLIIILTLFFLIYNTVFGWNKIPINEAEETCDYIFKIGMYLASIIYFSPLINVYENFIKKHEAIKKD